MKNWEVSQVPPEYARHYLIPITGLMNDKVFSDTLLYTAADIIVGAMNGELALFIFYEDQEAPFLFAAVKISQYPQGKAATIIALAGQNIRAAIEWREGFELWCQMQGCQVIYFNTHRKLAKIMERYGYRSRSVAVFKPLMTVN